MTTVVILMIGFGAVLIISSLETDPTTGQPVSIVQTVQDIWNDDVNFSQTAPTTTTGNPPGTYPATNIVPDTGPNVQDAVGDYLRYRYGSAFYGQ